MAMNRPIDPANLEHLTVTERLELIEALWASLEGLPDEAIPTPDWHVRETEKRLRSFDEGTSVGAPWEEVRARL